MTEPQPFATTTQAAFAIRLQEIERLNLRSALAEAVGGLMISDLDSELGRLVTNDRLARLAASGLRGETFFPCPLVLTAAPRLLAYYRLLYGISQKQFSQRGYGRFLRMELDGAVSGRISGRLPELTSVLIDAGGQLLDNLPELSLGTFRDLQLLTLGQQLKGGRLNEIGAAATRLVFARIRAAVDEAAIVAESETSIEIHNDSGRRVVVSFSSDPDIAITEYTETIAIRRLAIEIKGGTDVSNVHNRLGEAEKSHQKARAKGFAEFWTIVNVGVDANVAFTESPTTKQFFELGRIIDRGDPEWARFRDQLAARLGIRAAISR